MNVKICDICRANNKVTKSNWRISVKNNKGQALRLDACDEHSTFLKGKGYDKGSKEFIELLEKVTLTNELLK